MGKNNAFLAKLQVRKALDLDLQRLFTIQQAKDMMLIAAANAFGFGPKRALALSAAFDRAFNRYVELANDDATADKSIEYTRAKIDERLKQICGEHFVPWNERYDFTMGRVR